MMNVSHSPRRARLVKWLVAFAVLAGVVAATCCGHGHTVGMCILEGTAFGLLLGVLLAVSRPWTVLTPWRVYRIIRTHTNASTAVGLLAGLGKAAFLLLTG